MAKIQSRQRAPPVSDTFSSLTADAGSPGRRSAVADQTRRSATRTPTGPTPSSASAAPASGQQHARLVGTRRRIARAGAGSVELEHRRRQRELAAHLGPGEGLGDQRRVQAQRHVGAVEGIEIDQIEVDLPAQLKIQTPGDVVAADERVKNVDLVLRQLVDLVDAAR